MFSLARLVLLLAPLRSSFTPRAAYATMSEVKDLNVLGTELAKCSIRPQDPISGSVSPLTPPWSDRVRRAPWADAPSLVSRLFSLDTDSAGTATAGSFAFFPYIGRIEYGKERRSPRAAELTHPLLSPPAHPFTPSPWSPGHLRLMEASIPSPQS